jgi:hypothetical protein
MRLRLAALAFLALSFSAAAQPVDTIPAENDDVSLRDYMSARIDALQKIMDERDNRYGQRFEAQQENVASALQAAEKAVTKAEEAANKRFDSVNEFRQTLTDQAASFMSKAEADARLKANEDKITALTARLDDERSRGEGATTLWAIIVGVIGVAVLVIGFGITLSRQRTPSKP